MKPQTSVVVFSFLLLQFLYGCVSVSVPDEAQRLRALRAEPLSPQYRVALLPTGLNPLFLADVGYITQFGKQLAEGFSRQLPATVQAWKSPYVVQIAGNANLLDRVKINEYSRAQHAEINKNGYHAVLTVTVQPVASRVTNAKRIQEGYLARDLVQVEAVQGYVSLRTVPGDVLLYFDNGSRTECKIFYFEAGTADSAFGFQDTSDNQQLQEFHRQLSACVSQLGTQLLDNLEVTLAK